MKVLNYKTTSIFLATVSAALLTACSGGPKNKDIETAFQDQMNQANDIASSFLGDSVADAARANVSVKNTSCEKAKNDRYTCAFTLTSENDFTGRNTTETSGTFIKRDGRWVVSQGF
ncbi:MAG: hypothetical protein ABJ275_07470 [Maricaulaceae bacterium]